MYGAGMKAFYWSKIAGQQVGKWGLDLAKRGEVESNYHHAGLGIFLSTTALERETYM